MVRFDDKSAKIILRFFFSAVRDELLDDEEYAPFHKYAVINGRLLQVPILSV